MKVVLKDLTKKFSGQGKNAPDVIAVNNFNVEIPDGKLIGLLGPSGCGKSTALNLISGLLSPLRRDAYSLARTTLRTCRLKTAALVLCFRIMPFIPTLR
mgnify:CR=1 FL=1